MLGSATWSPIEIACKVSRQTHDIGVRMALGATRGDVLGMVLYAGMSLMGIGIAVGMLAKFGWNAHHVASTLRVPDDAVTLFCAVTVIVIAGLA